MKKNVSALLLIIFGLSEIIYSLLNRGKTEFVFGFRMDEKLFISLWVIVIVIALRNLKDRK